MRSYLFRWGIAVPVLLAAGQSIILGFFLVQSVPLRNNNPPVTSFMRLRGDENMVLSFIHLEDIHSDIWRAVLFIEDGRFSKHPGIDLESIRKALRVNRRAGRIVYGGSTVSQQLARTLFLSLERTYRRKYLEVLAALSLELALPKERILELYLNYVEWGPGVYGLVDASEHHFGVRPEELSDAQEQILVTLLASPIRYDAESFAESEQLSSRHRYTMQYYRAIRGLRVFESTIRRVE